METDKLKYFAVVAQTESVRRASDILKVTPSALSKTIKQLESELGVSLITPLGRGITLTREGKELARKSGEILRSIDLLKSQVQASNIKTREAPLRIAAFEVFSTHFLQVLEEVELGSRNLALHEAVPGELEELIEQGKADVAITYLPVANSHVEHVKITRILMGVYKRKGSFKNVPQEELPFVIPINPANGIANRVKGLDGWAEDAYKRNVKFEVTLLESALELCRQGKCVGYFPSFIVERHNKKYRDSFALERHPASWTLRRCYSDVFIVKRKDRTEDRDIKFVSKLLRLGTKLESMD